MAELYDPNKLHDLLIQIGYAPHHHEDTPHKKEIETSPERAWRKWISFYVLAPLANKPKLSTRDVGTVVAVIEVEIGGGQRTAMLMKSCDDPNELVEE